MTIQSNNMLFLSKEDHSLLHKQNLEAIKPTVAQQTADTKAQEAYGIYKKKENSIDIKL